MNEDTGNSKDSISKRIRRDWAPMVLTIIITMEFFATLAYLIREKVPTESRETVLAMIETLKTVWIMAVSYYFGTTAGSARKTEVIAASGPIKE